MPPWTACRPPNRARSRRMQSWPRRIAALVFGYIATAVPALGATPTDWLPPGVEAALAQAGVARSGLVAVVQDVDAAAPLLAWQPARPVNPASLMKLLTTGAALDRLGPAWTWQTPVWLAGRLADPGPRGVLAGDVVIRGSGDPSLVIERVWLLLRRIRQSGVQQVQGDFVLDSSAFSPGEQVSGDFDGELLRPYNVGANALLFNFKSVQLTLTPDAAAGVARVSVEPLLAGMRTTASVPLAKGRCDDWRGGLGLDFSDPAALRLGGTYPLACGQRQWPIAYPDAARYNHRLLAALWAEAGGTLGGTVRDGSAPAGVAPTFEWQSPPLVDVVRDINKYSNNVMAQQLFLTLGLTFAGEGSPRAARGVVQQWAQERLGAAGLALTVDNGSGLSRAGSVDAQLLAALLVDAWHGPTMAPFVASLPVSAVDGTLRRSTVPAGRAYLKTGSLRDVVGIAGYVLTDDANWRIVVGVVNHERAAAARPALDALVQWALHAHPRAAGAASAGVPLTLRTPLGGAAR